MRICEKLFSEINFEPTYISPCCNTRAIKIPAYPYKGGPLDVRAYAQYIQKAAREIQDGSTLCANCPEMKSLPESGVVAEMSFRAISINMHRFFCNCSCVYCDLWRHRERGLGYDVMPGLQSLKDAGTIQENCLVSWGGGEPSILPTFETTSDWILDNGYWQNIHTSALKFSPAIARLLGASMGHINVSLDSGSPEVYERVKGLNGFHKVLENLARYGHAGKPGHMTLKYIIFEENNDPREIEKFLRLARNLKVQSVEFSLNFRETNANAVSDQTLASCGFFMLEADKLGLKCGPAFIDPAWLDKIVGKMKEAV